MIDQFDARYPTPALAAAAERRERAEERKRLGRRQRTAVIRNRVASVTVAAALGAGMAGLVVLIAIPSRSDEPARAVAASIAVGPPAPKRAAVAPVAAVAPTALRKEAITPADTAMAIAHRRTPARNMPAAPLAAPGPSASSRWIAEPLHGEALRLALIEDRRRTIELNDAELQRLADH